jgi:hypothetical protein
MLGGGIVVLELCAVPIRHRAQQELSAASLSHFVSKLKEHKLENNSRATGGFVAAFFCGLLQSQGWNCAPTGRLLSTAPAALNFPANRSRVAGRKSRYRELRV